MTKKAKKLGVADGIDQLMDDFCDVLRTAFDEYELPAPVTAGVMAALSEMNVKTLQKSALAFSIHLKVKEKILAGMKEAEEANQ